MAIWGPVPKLILWQFGMADLSIFRWQKAQKDPAALSEKLTPLQQIRDNYPKYLLTMDEQEADYEGILQLNLVQWMKETV